MATPQALAAMAGRLVRASPEYAAVRPRDASPRHRTAAK
jgi:hypothetical protein